jgi:hypothetical protein
MRTFAIFYAAGAAMVTNCTFDFTNYRDGIEIEAGTAFYSDDSRLQSALFTVKLLC